MQGLSDQEKSDLDKPLVAAQTLSDHWKDWGFDKGRDFTAAPGASQLEKDTLATINASPALFKAVGADDSGNASDSNASHGKIQKDQIDKFLKKAYSDEDAAVYDYNDWAGKNSGASDTAKAFAHSAAEIEGNDTLLSAASSDPGRPVDGVMHIDELQTAGGDKGLSQTLSGAAKLWSNTGLFGLADTAAEDQLATNPDGIASRDDFKAVLTNTAPNNDTGIEALMNTAADKQATAGVDTSKVGKDLFTTDNGGNIILNPDNKADAATKAAVLSQLNQAKLQLVSNAVYPSQLVNVGINPNPDKIGPDIDARINALAGDQSVTDYLNSATDKAMESMTQADPTLKTGLWLNAAAFKSGDTLKADLAGKDKDGNPLPVGDALGNFAAQGKFFAQAFSTDGKDSPDIDLNKITHQSGQYDAILKAFKDDMVSGNAVGDNINGFETNLGANEPKSDALSLGAQAFASEMQSYASVLDKKDIQDNAPQLQDNYQSQVEGKVVQGASDADYLATFGTKDGSGNWQFDQNKSKDIVSRLVNTNPEAFIDKNGNPVPVTDILFVLNGLYGTIRSGTHAYVALQGIGLFGGPLNGNKLTHLYNDGTLHSIAAIFGGIELGFQVAGQVAGGNATPAQIAGDFSSAAYALGLGMVSGGQIAQQMHNLGGANALLARSGTNVQAAQADLDAKTNLVNTWNSRVPGAQSALDQAKKILQRVSDVAYLDYLQHIQIPAPEDSPQVEAALDDVKTAQKDLDTINSNINDAQNAARNAGKTLQSAGEARDYAQEIVNGYKTGSGPSETRAQMAEIGKLSYKPNTFDKVMIDVGTGLAGASFVLSGALNINTAVKDSNTGDKAGAALNGLSGGLYTLTGIGGLAEAGESAAAAAGARVPLSVLLATDAIVGPITAVALGAGFITSIYEIVKASQQAQAESDNTVGNVHHTLQQYGIDGGPIMPGDEKLQEIPGMPLYSEGVL